MKRLISALLMLCLLLPAAGLSEERLPRIKFPAIEQTLKFVTE